MTSDEIVSSVSLSLPVHYVHRVRGDGFSLQWSHCGAYVFVIKRGEELSLMKVDSGAEEADRVHELPFSIESLQQALTWLTTSEDMLIRRTRSACPVDRPINSEPVVLPLVSVVVACYGALDYTKQLVSSLQENAGCGYELILVDDCCPENTWQWAAYHGIRCIRHHTNQGLPITINEGARAATGGVLALWNSDMIVYPNGLRILAEAAVRHGIAAQTGGYFGPDGNFAGQTSKAWRSDYPEGYCLTIRRDVWEDVGEWDPVYHPTICDDTDWALRARLKGHRFVFVRDAVYHIGGQSVGIATMPPGYVAKNQETLRQKYAPLGLGERILVRRWGASGDLIMATPALRALKAAKPLALLHLQCHSTSFDLMLAYPYVDSVFERVPTDIHYTQNINLNGAYEDAQRNDVYEHPALAFCRVAGVNYDNEPYDYPATPHLAEWAKSLLPTDVTLVACGLRSAYRPKQNWKAEKWVELADLLPDNFRLVALDNGANSWFDPHGPTVWCEEFYRHPRVLNITGTTPSLSHAAALIEQCHGFVGVDSGLLHVASARRKPVVNLCAAAPEQARTPLVGLRQAFEGRADCFPCQFPDSCPHSSHCLDWVQPAQVARWIIDHAQHPA